MAAPYCSSRLGNVGARIIKIERPEDDFARGYDTAVFGESSYFVWINRGKESIVLDLRNDEAKTRLHTFVAEADVFIQNLTPGAVGRLGFGSDALRAKHSRLITFDISGYGESCPSGGVRPAHRLAGCRSSDRGADPYGAINSVHDLIDHPQLRTRAMLVNGRRAQTPATPYVTEWDNATFAPAPRVGEHREILHRL